MVRSKMEVESSIVSCSSSSRNCRSNNNSQSSDKRGRRGANVLHWFRSKGLRFHDQPSLYETIVKIDEEQKNLIDCGQIVNTWRCVYLLDPWFAISSNSANKWSFLLQSLEDLDNSLRKMNSRLFVIRGQPTHIFPELLKEWNITHFTFEFDPEPFAVYRDESIVTLCNEMNIKVNSCPSHTVCDITEIMKRWHATHSLNDPITFKAFQMLIASSSTYDAKLPCPVIDDKLMKGFTTPLSDEHEKKFGVPELSELGLFTGDAVASCYKWPGGEHEALSRLERHLQHIAWVAAFGKPKMTLNSLSYGPQTGLSPYLRFGCLSSRLFHFRLSDLYYRVKKSPPPRSLHGQLLWRDFFYAAASDNPYFDRMKNNRICLQIKWDKNPFALAKWAEGKTGFPWIDAIQSQLRQEGWIHPVARHATACFLTRGALWISWEEGMKVFDELLLDADWSVNAGTWMWMSCSSFFHNVFHIYCPVKFGRKIDPHGDYIRKYVAPLKSLPSQYIHEPWRAPLFIQQKYHCVVGETYPVPMIDHVRAAKRNLERMRKILAPLANSLQLDISPELPSVDHSDHDPG